MKMLMTRCLQAGVILDQTRLRGVGVPGVASVIQLVAVDETRDLGLPLHHLDSEALRGVPCDVAVSDPDL